MADIELVIKIPEETYKLCMNNNFGAEILKAVKNGTPLPKGHGRLKDVDTFIAKVKADREHACYVRSWTADDVLQALDKNYAPTIIEGDKWVRNEAI